MNDKIYEYKGKLYPFFLKTGNAMSYIERAAVQFCKGKGLDIGSSYWPLPGSTAIDMDDVADAYNLPDRDLDFIFSSHCLEHLENPVAALEIWREHLKPGGCLFLYLPHPDMEYWLPQNNRKHLHAWRPEDLAKIVSDLGYTDVIHSERDIYWSFTVIAFAPDRPEQTGGMNDAWTH